MGDGFVTDNDQQLVTVFATISTTAIKTATTTISTTIHLTHSCWQ